MNLDIIYKTKDSELEITCKGFFVFSCIHFSNNHDFIKHKIKLDNKLFGGGKIIEYYPPDYIGDKKMTQKNIDGKKEADEDTLTYKKTVILEDGVHTGKIESLVREDRGGYDYLDIQINTQNADGEGLIISASMPTAISDFSALGKILIKAGFSMEYEDEISITTIGGYLKDKEITFRTTTEETAKGNFARVLNDTIKFN